MVVVSLDSVRAEADRDWIGRLYGAHGRLLAQIVRRRVSAPEAVIEDACQFAWNRLVRHRHRVQAETALGWLVTTATREAVKLARDHMRAVSLDQLTEKPGAEEAIGSRVPAADEVALQRARLDAVGELSERQQRLVWMQGLGLSYDEMARQTGATPRTVERQLLRARRALRD